MYTYNADKKYVNFYLPYIVTPTNDTVKNNSPGDKPRTITTATWITIRTMIMLMCSEVCDKLQGNELTPTPSNKQGLTGSTNRMPAATTER